MSERQEQIAVTVASDGTITAETLGITGAACLDHIAVLEDLLEAETVSSRFTEDYDRATTSTGVDAMTYTEGTDGALGS